MGGLYCFFNLELRTVTVYIHACRYINVHTQGTLHTHRVNQPWVEDTEALGGNVPELWSGFLKQYCVAALYTVVTQH